MSDLVKLIHDTAPSKAIKLMEVCGTHTVSIFRHGIKALLPKQISLISGPGCPVCVTSVNDIDAAIALSKMPEVILVTFGDMMHVPGSNRMSLHKARAYGARSEVVYSPRDALQIASDNSNSKVVFFATGFETTSPLIAATIEEAIERGVNNFYVYSAHKLVPPALRALLSSPDVKIDGFILPGHVSAIIGKAPYEFIASEFTKPGVITGFNSDEILMGIYMLLVQIAANDAQIQIQYSKVVRPEGNPKAVSMIEKYFDVCDAYWRGIGAIPSSGLNLKEKYSHFDAKKIFQIDVKSDTADSTACMCGDVLRGIKTPPECALFGKGCKPENPVGACMVSAEGSCAAYYRYGGATVG
ncbi:hydrogenase formation protein HypD [Candidatus Magnetomonas plexicatena]|uniref:hydrogenase formation protein HypD n=1 Tax=Candidatus Magnetomonas plexicatena TaxID=2552947 RepID=UPI004032B9CD